MDYTITEETYSAFLEYLNTIKEEDYKRFSEKLIFTNYEILGIRSPILRKLAKAISKEPFTFLEHKKTYYEEVMLEGLVLSFFKDITTLEKYLPAYITKIDNWALCDTPGSSLKIIGKNREYFLPKIKKMILSKETYEIRFGYLLLLAHYKDKKYLDTIFSYIDLMSSKEYYVQMIVAWLLCECFLLDQDKTITYILNSHLDNFTYNKALQKMIESNRITKETKKHLKTLKRK